MFDEKDLHEFSIFVSVSNTIDVFFKENQGVKRGCRYTI